MMDQDFGTKKVEARHILGIRTSTTMDEIGEMMGPLFGEVYALIQQSGQEPAGMPFARYYSMDGHRVELECGMPVASPIEGAGRVTAGELPTATVATATHVGPYEGLPGTWSSLTEWMGSQGLQPAGAPWEVYVTDPGAEPDSSKWRTEIFFPVR